jgi:hypothetical protein
MPSEYWSDRNRLVYATISDDDEGATGAILWLYAARPRGLAIIDIEASSISRLGETFPHLVERVLDLARALGITAVSPQRDPMAEFLASFNPVPQFDPLIFAPPELAQLMALKGVGHPKIPDWLATLPSEKMELRAASITAAGLVTLSKEAAQKANQHPYNEIIGHRVGARRSALRRAYALGVLVGLLDQAALL